MTPREPLQENERIGTILWKGETVWYFKHCIVVKLKATGIPFTEMCKALESAIPGLEQRREPGRRGRVAYRLASQLDVLDVLRRLNERDDVEWAEPDMVNEIATIPNDPMYSQQWGLPKILINGLWNDTTGSAKVLIGIVDSGIALDDSGNLNHPDLMNSNRYIAWKNYVNPNHPPKDDHGHGTHVLGIAAADSNNGTGIAGVNWTAKWYICKVADAGGYIQESDATDAFDEIVDYAIKNGYKVVINYSAGGATATDTMHDACKYISDNGMILCAATGNDSPKPVEYPARYSANFPTAVLAVGSSNEADQVSKFSNYGPQVSVVAPGERICSTLPTYPTTTTNEQNNYTGYGYLSGTSMATPFATGLVSVLWGLLPGSTNGNILDLIKANAVPLDTNKDKYGYGRINTPQTVDLHDGGTDWGDNRYTTCLAYSPEGDATYLGIGRDSGENSRFVIYTVSGDTLSNGVGGGTDWGEDRACTGIAFTWMSDKMYVGVGRSKGNRERFQVYPVSSSGLGTPVNGGKDWEDDRSCTGIAFGKIKKSTGTTTNYVGVGRNYSSKKTAKFIVYPFDGSTLGTGIAGGADWGSGRATTCIAFGPSTNDGVFVGVGRNEGSNARFYLYSFNGSDLKSYIEGGNKWGDNRSCTCIAFGQIDHNGNKTAYVGVGRNAGENERFFIYKLTGGALTDEVAGGSDWQDNRSCTSIAFKIVNDRTYVVVGRNDGNGARFIIYPFEDGMLGAGTDMGTEWGDGRGCTAAAFGERNGLAYVGVGRNKGEHYKYQHYLFSPWQ